MEGTTLTQLGWNATDERTDPPKQESDIVRPISNGYTGMMIRERGKGSDRMIYCENPVEIDP